MQQTLEKNRWIALVSCILCQCVCNFPAMWAVFQPYVAAEYGYTQGASTLVMPMCVVFFGVISIIGGRVQDTVSPKIAGLIGTALIGMGFINAWWIPAGQPLYMYVGFCLFFGGGCGFLMQASIANLMKWYADKKGFAGGITGAVAGLYCMAAIFGAEFVLSRFGARTTMLFVGIASWAIGFLMCLTLVIPTRQYIEEKDAAGKQKTAGKQRSKNTEMVDFTPAEMLRTPQYYLLTLSLLAIIPAFQLISPQMVSLCIQKGLTKEVALSATAIAAGATALGRFVIPMISDRIGRKETMAAMWACTLALAIAFMFAGGTSILVVFALLSFCYSGGFAVNMPFINDMFGFKNAGTNSGFVNISGSVGSLLGPMLLNLAIPLLGTYAVHIVGIAGAAISLCCMLAINPNTAKTKRDMEEKLLQAHKL